VGSVVRRGLPREVLERRAAVTGIGQSAVGRRLGADPLALTIDACLEALADAGLRREDIDGLSTYPGGAVPGAPGFTGAGIVEVGSVINACMAVATGLARHVLCFRTVWESTAQGGGRRAGIGAGGGGRFRASGFMQWTLPFGAASAANWIAMMAMRHFHEYGTTREQLAQIALNARRNAARNPRAIYRDPMTLEDYLAARMITEPFCLFDCDVPVDGSTAIVISSLEAARDLRRPPLQVEAVGCAIRGRPSWDQWDDLTTMALRDAGAMLFERSGLRPADVDVAELYDGFSFITLAWLEALGFCPKGEGGRFVEGGGRIALDGEIPVNTHGGQLSAGRLHGYGFLHEAALQLWGEGGERQVLGDPAVAIAAAGGGPLAGCLMLVRR